MRAFTCHRCAQRLFFENSVCLRCGAEVGFAPSRGELVVRADSPGLRPCANARIAGCNWLVDAGARAAREDDPGEGALCASCRLTRTRPGDGDSAGLAAFAVAEAAKRRLLFQLRDLNLPIESDLGFDLLSSAHGPVSTGHADGLITIDLAESDDARREARRQQLAEPYRTLLGHFRHEIGHYYEPILVDRGGHSEAARARFGDERADYGAALEAHYAAGPPADWAQRHVSAYATMHPYEDWAETFAHYLHIRDTLQTAAAFELHVGGPTPSLRADPTDALAPDLPFSALLADWLPLTYALNQVNRSMGHDDLYPFTLAPAVIDKLTFVHACVTGAGAASGPPGPLAA
ncbi:putative zinc-binding metallopeptidase [Conexibacter sp. DBS9H8]|uniref:zinc-binding metallopeptidase family protein n=1 Tax=Conexibacter sp. DBS9H8 TaxID=2937801 RepID=UPI002010B952|nr:putative zinc-binding metallopeptidase [Conexibacter sp. DBS9H8]